MNYVTEADQLLVYMKLSLIMIGKENVPNIENEQAVFWIHQFKLLEGIDDYRFQVLAIYEK